MMRALLTVALALAAAPATAQVQVPAGMHVTPQQLLAAADRLVAERRFVEAAPLVAALALAPGYAMHSRFLAGLIAAESGDAAGAARQFKAILADDPRQTRVRLELARALIALNRPQSADRQFRLAEQDAELPPEIARTIRTVRDTIRGARTWRFDVNYGIAPDSNINNATAADAITLVLGNTPVPVTLDEDATARSGIGQTGRASAGLRLPLADTTSLIAEFDATGSEYRGSAFDDYFTQAAIGAEYRLSSAANLSLQALGTTRWFGDRLVSHQTGLRAGAQATTGPRTRMGLQLDLRRTTARFDRAYGGWQGGLYATVERAVGRAFLISAGPFVRRDWLREPAFSSTELGGTIGAGGELRRGFNLGASLGYSEARFDAALPIFDPRPRHDRRLTARATLGNRKLRLLGLSPQLALSHTRIASSLDYYDMRRTRIEATLARYF